MSVLQGLVPVLATPFEPGGGLDPAGLRRLVEFQLRHRVDGVATFGMASEAFALTADERARILGVLREVIAGAVPVVAGVGATSIVTAVEQARAAADGGADALMVLPPYLVKPDPAQLVDFYGEVAAAAGIPVMVQDAAAATGLTMSPELIGQLGTLDGVTSVKIESPPTAPKVTAVAKLTGSDLDVFGGQNAQFVVEEFARGAIGTMPACEFPDLLRPVVDDLAEGRIDQARRAFTPLLPLVLFGLQSGIAWAVHKEVLVRRGVIEHATVRSPARDLDAAGRAALEAILTDLGLGDD